MNLNPNFLQLILDGAWMTVQVSLLSAFFGMLLGILFLILQKVNFKPVSLTFELLLVMLRGLPEIVLVFLVYYGGSQILLTYFDYEFTAYFAGITALSLVFAAYASQSLRGAIEAIPAGQSLAAYSMGLSKTSTFFKIILPQMWRLAIPGLTNQWLSLLKDSSLVSTIGIAEILFQTNSVIKVTHLPFEWYAVAACFYLVISVSSTKVLKYLEVRSNRYLVASK